MMSGASRTLAHVLETAKTKGLDVVFPEPNQLFLDLDTAADFAWFQEHLPLLRENGFGPCEYIARPSKSGGQRQHVIVTLNRAVTAVERIAMQACLGSDRKHELLSVIEAPTNEKPTCFFEARPKVVHNGDLTY